MTRYRIGVDTGGTFTDFIVFDEKTGKIARVFKTSSTPRDPARAVMDGLLALAAGGIKPEQVSLFSHGTTVGTNALLEGKGARTGLLLTEGFRAINDVVRSAASSSEIYNVYGGSIQSLVPGRLCLGIRERIDFEGKVITPLDKEKSRQAVKELKKKGAESIAVCLLFSFLNSSHEQELKKIIEDEYPECPVSLSSEILPRIRELIRTSTIVVNAQLVPIMNRYLNNLEDNLKKAGVGSNQIYVMQSNGGVGAFRSSSKRPVYTILSGPVAGVVAASMIGSLAGYRNIVSLDMGGTSTDIALIEDGKAQETTEGKIGEWPVAIPMLDINTIGAGGGSIAWLDEVSNLKVGPRSAGADPGPACYDKGGANPAVTDANVVLGFINPDYFLGGALKIDKNKSEEAIKSKIAEPLQMDLLEAADGIVKIVNTNMAQGVKVVSTERGYDLRDFVLFAFGGCGPVHAGRLAADLGIPKVLVPPFPGATSSLGLLLSDIKRDYVQSRLTGLAEANVETVNRTFKSLRDKAIVEHTAEGFSERELNFSYFFDMRYIGQGYELTIPLPGKNQAEGRGEPPVETENGLKEMKARFDEYHKRLFGHHAPQQPVEIVSFRIAATIKVPQMGFEKKASLKHDASQALKGRRQVNFGAGEGGQTICPIYERELLLPGNIIPGPAIIEQMDSTIVVYPGQTSTVDEYGDVMISIKETMDVHG